MIRFAAAATAAIFIAVALVLASAFVHQLTLAVEKLLP